MTQLTVERDRAIEEVGQLGMKLKDLQMDLLEKEVRNNKEQEKVDFLEDQLRSANKDLSEYKIKANVDVKSTKEYQTVLRDLQLLLSHKEEIIGIKEYVQSLKQQQTQQMES